METLRRAEFQGEDPSGVLSDISTDKLSIATIGSKEIEGVIDDYPFEGQTVYFGTFSYSKGHPFDEELVHEVEIDFSIRTQSGFFTLQNGQDQPQFADLIQEINRSLPEEVIISSSINPGNDEIWNFINQARDILSVEVLYEGQIQEFLDLNEEDQDVVRNEAIVDSAELVFEFSGDLVTIVYDGRRLNLDQNHEETREYVVQTLEKIIHSEGGS